MKILALLPMKLHSERVPGKNFRELYDKPLYRWVLDTLLSIEMISAVVINTDAADKLQETGLCDGGKVLIRQRHEDLCGDFVSMNAIIKDDIEAESADLYVMTHVTNPLLSAATIERAIESLQKSTHDSLFSVNKWQTRFYRADGDPVNHNPKELLRTQDLEAWYEENSCLYLFTKESFAKTNARIGEDPLLFEMPRLESIDIDEPEDWVLAEALASSTIQTNHA